MAIILITGCSSGFGLAAALAFARRGDTVIATVRDLARSRPLWQADLASRIDVLELDINDPAARVSAVSHALTTYGRIDVLVNNAGTFSFGPTEFAGEAGLRDQFEANVFGSFAMLVAVVPHMRQRGGGRIVNVTSAGAFGVRPFMTAYAASKHAMDAISSGMDGELRPFNIRVTSVAPVSFVTNIVRGEPGHDTLYGALPGQAFARFIGMMKQRPDLTPVVDAIIEASTVAEPKLRYLVAPPGSPAEAVISAKDTLDQLSRPAS